MVKFTDTRLAAIQKNETYPRYVACVVFIFLEHVKGCWESVNTMRKVIAKTPKLSYLLGRFNPVIKLKRQRDLSAVIFSM